MKWFAERTLTGIAHLLSSQPGTPELYNFVALFFVFAFLAFNAAHWPTFDGTEFTDNCGTILEWWGVSRIAAATSRLIDGGKG